MRDSLALHGGRHHFWSSSRIASMSRICSASNRFSFAFASSSAFSRVAMVARTNGATLASLGHRHPGMLRLPGRERAFRHAMLAAEVRAFSRPPHVPARCRRSALWFVSFASSSALSMGRTLVPDGGKIPWQVIATNQCDVAPSMGQGASIDAWVLHVKLPPYSWQMIRIAARPRQKSHRQADRIAKTALAAQSFRCPLKYRCDDRVYLHRRRLCKSDPH